MTRTELYRLFNRFKALCQLSGTPGRCSKKIFKDGVSSLAFEDDEFVDRVFNLLDENGSGPSSGPSSSTRSTHWRRLSVRQADLLLQSVRRRRLADD